jgi:hypothetical protein
MERDVEWTAEPDFSGREFTNTMCSPQAQIHIEQAKWMGPWQITIADSDGFLWNDRLWPGSADKPLREAVQKAVGVVRDAK